MKKSIIILSLAVLTVFSTQAQEFPKLDASPMDMAYYPARAAFRSFAKTDEEKAAGQPKIRVIYSRPAAKGRKVFGDLEKYGNMWRMGANESTEILFYQDVTINGKKVVAGRYTLYAKLAEKEWTLYLSTDKDGWGHYAFNAEGSSVAEITVPTAKTKETVENVSILFEAADGGADMIIGWDDTMVRVPIKF